MTPINWNSNVNTKIRRSGSSWSETSGFITDRTRSGKPKRRGSHQYSPRPFTVKMIFSETEYQYFTEWFNVTDKKGLLPFYFPQIDKSGVVTNKVYQFVEGGEPTYNNSSGDNIECTMKWEEV